jgi:hypothetical protein
MKHKILAAGLVAAAALAYLVLPGVTRAQGVKAPANIPTVTQGGRCAPGFDSFRPPAALGGPAQYTCTSQAPVCSPGYNVAPDAKILPGGKAQYRCVAVPIPG